MSSSLSHLFYPLVSQFPHRIPRTKDLLARIVPYIVILLHAYAIVLLVQLPQKQARKTYISEFNLKCTLGKTLYTQELASQDAMMYLQQMREREEGLDAMLAMKARLAYTSHVLRDELGLEVSGAFGGLEGYNGMDGKDSSHVEQNTKGSAPQSIITWLRPTRASGKEAVLLSVKLPNRNTTAFMLSLLRVLKLKAKWMSKDLGVIFEAQPGDVARYVHNYVHGGADTASPHTPIPRSGRVFASIAVDNIGDTTHPLNRLIVILEPHGSMPNLDLLNIFTQAAHNMGGRSGLDPASPEEEHSGTLRLFLLYLWNGAFSVPRTHAAHMSQVGLASLGVSTNAPNGEGKLEFLLNPYRAHGAERQSGNSTQTVSPFDIQEGNVPVEAVHFYAAGSILEEALHHIQNTDEALHQSFEEYLLTGATNFIENEQNLCIVLMSVALLLRPVGYLLIGASGTNFAFHLLRAMPSFGAKLLSGWMIYLFPRVLQLLWFSNVAPWEGVQWYGLSLIATLATFSLWCAFVYAFHQYFLRFIVSQIVAGLDDLFGWRTTKPHNTAKAHAKTTLCTIFYLFCVSHFSTLRSATFAFFVLCIPMVEIKSSGKSCSRFTTSLRVLLAQPFIFSSLFYAFYKIGVASTLFDMIVNQMRFDSMVWELLLLVQLPLMLVQLERR